MDQRRNRKLGDWGEAQACGFLKRQGFVVVERNYHTTQGEIDIVAKKAGDYYFVEVKTRESGAMATDLAITRAKKHKLEKTVKRYCYARGIGDASLVLASLMVVVNRTAHSIQFRLAVLY